MSIVETWIVDTGQGNLTIVYKFNLFIISVQENAYQQPKTKQLFPHPRTHYGIATALFKERSTKIHFGCKG